MSIHFGSSPKKPTKQPRSSKPLTAEPIEALAVFVPLRISCRRW